MKRRDVIKKLQAEAKARGLQFSISELTRHSEVRVGHTSRTLGRHNEIDDLTARKFWDQFSNELGKGWWR